MFSGCLSLVPTREHQPEKPRQSPGSCSRQIHDISSPLLRTANPRRKPADSAMPLAIAGRESSHVSNRLQARKSHRMRILIFASGGSPIHPNTAICSQPGTLLQSHAINGFGASNANMKSFASTRAQSGHLEKTRCTIRPIIGSQKEPNRATWPALPSFRFLDV